MKFQCQEQLYFTYIYNENAEYYELVFLLNPIYWLFVSLFALTTEQISQGN